MKTLHFSSIAAVALCLSLFASCTKDAPELSASAVSASSDQYLSAAAKKESAGNETEMTDFTSASENGQKAVATFTTFNLVSNPSVVGSIVQMNVAVSFSKEVYNTNIIIERSSTKDALGNWTNWVAVDGFKEQISIQKNKGGQPVKLHSFTRSFEATEVGETGWRVHITGGDVHNSYSNTERLVINPACNAFELTGKLAKAPEHIVDNEYRFEVLYTITTCVPVTNAKLQGGLTAVSGLPETYPGASNIKTTNNDNHVITWMLGDLKAGDTKTYKVTFTKKLKGEGPYTITGNWTAKGIDPETGLEKEFGAADPVVF